MYIVEDPGFISLVKSLEPSYKIPSRRYFTENVFLKVLKLRWSKFCIVQMSNITALPQIFGAQIHGFERLSVVLHVTLLEESHTRNYICEKFCLMLLTGELTKKMYTLYSVTMHLT